MHFRYLIYEKPQAIDHRLSAPWVRQPEDSVSSNSHANKSDRWAIASPIDAAPNPISQELAIDKLNNVDKITIKFFLNRHEHSSNSALLSSN
jgi:hypothetical protein